MNKNYFRQTKAFSLLEILIYTAIVGTVTTFLGGVLVSVTKIQSRTSASVEVNQQLNFVLNTVQRLVGESSVVEIPNGAATSTLVLRMPPSSSDPTSIYLQNNTIYLKQGTATATPLTSDQVVVNDLKFLKTSQYPGHDSVQVDLAVGYNTQNPEFSFSKTLSSAIARVSAATFDSDLIPGADNTYDIGLGVTRWQDMSLSGNLMVGGNVGVGTASPNARLTVQYSGTSGGGKEGLLINQTGTGGAGLAFDRNGALTGLWQVFQSTDNKFKIGRDAVADYVTIDTSGNVGIGTAGPGAKLDIADTTQNAARILLSGQEFYLAGNTMTNGPALLLGVNRANNKQLWIADSARLTQNTTNPTIWTIIADTYTAIGSRATDGITNLFLALNPNGGNVGIGTTNPTSKLDVNGTAQMTGFKMPTGASNNYVLTSDASGIGTWQASGGGGGGGGGEGAVHGSGAANYVAKWTDSSNIGNSQIFDDGANVGIGTTTPGAKLHIVNGNARFSAVSEAWSEGIRIDVARNAWGGIRWYRGDANYNGNWGLGYKNDSTDDLVFINNNGGTQYDRLALTKSGNVGIGTVVPGFKLDVVEDNQARIGDAEIGSWPANPAFAYFGHQALDHSIPGNYAVLQSADGNTYVNYASGKNLFFRENNSDKMIISNGNVGIGTTAPAAKLHVSAGDSSLAYFGPNTSWGGKLYVGASPNVSGTQLAQVISTDGNLHLDNATGKTMYLNYYQSGNIVMNNAGGNVGIGMNPTYKLDVNGQIRATDIYLTDGVKIEGLSGRNYFRDVEGAGDLRVGAAWGMPGVYAESGAGVLGGAGGASLQNNSLFVTNTGKVGIGTTNPGLLPYIHITPIDAELRVAGDVMIDGYIAGATYGFGGLYQIDDCGVNNVFNWLTQGFSCPAGFTARQYGRVRAAESNCGASQYVCIKAFSTVSP